MKNWPLAGRDVHLLGGVFAINQPQSKEITVFPSTLDGVTAEISIPTYEHLYWGLKTIGISDYIGTDFYTHISQINGSFPCEWRVQTRYKSIPWSLTEATRRWSNISYQGYELKNAFLWDIAKRISHQINTLNESYKTLSLSYRKQLSAITKREKVEVGRRFEDGFSSKIYDSFQHFLFDACTLRDYLSEFIFHFLISNEEKQDIKHMTTASRIFKKFFKHTEQPTECRKYFKASCKD